MRLRPTRHRLRVLLIALAVLTAAAATVSTVPASAVPYRVVVLLEDGTTKAYVIDLPPGSTLPYLGGAILPGTPISIEELPVEPPPEEPPPPAPDPPPAESPGTPPPGPPAPPYVPPPGDPAPAPHAPGPGQTPSDDSPAVRRGGGRNWPDTKRPQTWLELETTSGGAVARIRRMGRRGPLRNPDGTPTRANPGFTDVLLGPSTVTGVPNFIIRKFRVPPFLLPIYQAAGIEYGVRWEVLAAINELETDYGRNLNVSSAGALGWMQFMPSSWRRYGVDANKDGRKDPYNPVDAIFAAARYLDAAGYENDPRGAIFAYNHADWYVDAVLLRARLIAGVPADLIGSLTGLTEARFPVRARATYADDIAERELLRRVRRGENAAHVVESDDRRRSIDIFARAAAPVVAVNDGVIRSVGNDTKLGRHVVLEDAYGNRYTYAWLGRTNARLTAGSHVIGGAVLGRVGRGTPGYAPHVDFSIRPAGRGAPRIDPKPILDGWKLLEATAIYRAKGKNVLRDGPTVGQILLLSKSLLQKRVLADERIEIYDCGRADIKAGLINRRVLATLAYLAESGLSPTVTSLRCGHSYHTKSGNVSHHSSGNAVDIAKLNDVPVLGHQEPGGVVDQAVRRIMQLQGAFTPAQVISLFAIGGPTIAMSDHADHIHVGFQPARGGLLAKPESVLKPGQWSNLIARLREIPNPDVERAARRR